MIRILRCVDFAALKPHFEEILIVAVSASTQRDRSRRTELASVGVNKYRNESVIFRQTVDVTFDFVDSFLKASTQWMCIQLYVVRRTKKTVVLLMVYLFTYGIFLIASDT